MTKQFTMEDRFNPSAVEQAALPTLGIAKAILNRPEDVNAQATVSRLRRRT